MRVRVRSVKDGKVGEERDAAGRDYLALVDLAVSEAPTTAPTSTRIASTWPAVPPTSAASIHEHPSRSSCTSTLQSVLCLPRSAAGKPSTLLVHAQLLHQHPHGIHPLSAA